MYRNPAIHWVFMLLTGGLYGLWWGLRVVREVNALAGDRAWAVDKHARVFLFGVGAYFALSIFGWVFLRGPAVSEAALQAYGWPAMILALYVNCHFVWMLIKTARLLRQISGEAKPRSGMVVFLYWFLMWAIPYLQDYLNIYLHRLERAARAGTACGVS